MGSDNSIRLGPEFSFSAEEMVTQRFGILAVSGAGKSNCAAVMAEEMYRLGLPFVAIDPKGDWWGLRAPGDGNKVGLNIPIFGGRHGDVPLEKTGGQLVADLVVDERISCVIDISDMSEGDKIRFLIDFAERLYKRNEEPLHLFLDEADDYCPQQPFREQARLVRAWENIVRRGRVRGLGMTMITQRSAAINKNILTQIGTLIVLRTTGPQDRKAIEGWIKYKNQSKEVLDSLPGLANGEAWVWSPEWLKVMKRVHFRRRQTFDSGATPKNVKGARPAATMATVDLDKVRKQMAGTIERAKAEDPRELRRQIADLKQQLAAAQKGGTKPCDHGPAISDLKVQIAALKGENRSVVQERKTAAVALQKAEDLIQRGLSQLSPAVNQLLIERTEDPLAVRVSAPHITNERSRPMPPRPMKSAGFSDANLSASQQRILDSLAAFEAIGMERVHKNTLAAMAQASPTSGGYFNNLGRLRSLGYIDYPEGGYAVLTETGRSIAQHSMPLDSLEQYHSYWLSLVSGSQRAILETLLSKYPKQIKKDELADMIGVSATSGGFFNNLGRLRTLGAIDYPSPGYAKASDLLFPDGLA